MFKKNKHFVFLIIFFLISSIFFITAKVLMIKADPAATSYGSYSGTSVMIDSIAPRLGIPCQIVNNSSGVGYFIPANTADEWNAFASHLPGGVSLSACTCTSFTYSEWTGCNGSTQARSIIGSTPSNCTGGSPVLSQACSCSTPGCTTGYSCKTGTIYAASSVCTSTNYPMGLACTADTYPNDSCINNDNNTSRMYHPASGCTTPVSCSLPGCKPGNKCANIKIYSSNTICSGSPIATSPSSCISDVTPWGCISGTAYSVSLSADTGCSYSPY